MSSAAQINANRENSKFSTGPVTPAGAERSSRNATKHGLTSQTLVVSPEEREVYQAHVQSYMDVHQPASQPHRQLVQQLADAHWSVHQAFVLQTNAIALINAINVQMSEAGDPVATAAALAPATRQLNTYSIYEGRRRRAAKAIEQDLAAFEQQLAEQRQEAIHNETKPQPEFGFDHSTRQFIKAADELAAFEATLRARLEAGVAPEEEAVIRKTLEA